MSKRSIRKRRHRNYNPDQVRVTIGGIECTPITITYSEVQEFKRAGRLRRRY